MDIKIKVRVKRKAPECHFANGFDLSSGLARKKTYFPPRISFSRPDFSKSRFRSGLFLFDLFRKNIGRKMTIFQEIHNSLTIRVGWAILIFVSLISVSVFRASGNSDVSSLGEDSPTVTASSGVSVMQGTPKVSVSSQEVRIADLEKTNSELEAKIKGINAQLRYFPTSSLENPRQAEDIARHDGQISDLEGQMKALTEQNKSLIDFSLALDYNSIIYKDKKGNLILEDGKIKASEVSAETLIVSTSDEKKAIGRAVILAVKKDDNLDGFDDETMSDGKTAVVKTPSVSDTGKIFLTPRSKEALKGPLTVIETRSGEYFKVGVAESVTEDTEFDWLIVEEK